MTAKKLATAAIGAAVALLIADAALAQAAPPKPAATTGAAVPPLSATPPGAPAGPALKLGPAIPGLCTYSQKTVLGASLVGKAVFARLQQLQTAIDAERNTDQAAIDAEQKSIQTAAAQPGADGLALQQRQELLQAKFNAAQRKSQVREREMQMTEQKQLSRVLTEAQPFAVAAFQAKSCSILLDGDNLLAGNPAMDITADVVKQLNLKIQTLTFDRERMDATPAAPAAPKK